MESRHACSLGSNTASEYPWTCSHPHPQTPASPAILSARYCWCALSKPVPIQNSNSWPCSWSKTPPLLSSASVLKSALFQAYLLVAELELGKLPDYVLLEVVDGLGDRLEHLIQLPLEPPYLSVHHIVVHLPPALLVNQIVVDIGLFREPLHLEGHFHLVQQLSYVHDEGVDVVTAVLLLEQARRAAEPVSALRVLAEVLDGLGRVLGAGHLVLQDVGLLDLLGVGGRVHQLYNLIITRHPPWQSHLVIIEPKIPPPIMPRKIIEKVVKPAVYSLAPYFGPAMADSYVYDMPPTRTSLNAQVFRQIDKMKRTAAHYNLGYLTTNHVAEFDSILLLNRKTHLAAVNSLTDDAYCNAEDFEVYINPKVEQGWELEEVEEACLVFPFFRFIVPRFNRVEVSWQGEDKVQRIDTFEGRKGRLLQHGISHLRGDLDINYDISKGRFSISNQADQHFPKTNFLAKEYSLRLKKHHNLPQKQQKQNKQAFEKMNKQYLARLAIEYAKEKDVLQEKLDKRQIHKL